MLRLAAEEILAFYMLVLAPLYVCFESHEIRTDRLCTTMLMLKEVVTGLFQLN